MWIFTDEEPQRGKYAGRRIRIKDIGQNDAYKELNLKRRFINQTGTIPSTIGNCFYCVFDKEPLKSAYSPYGVAFRQVEIEFIDDPDNNY